MFVFVLDNFALFVRTSYLFEVNYPVFATVIERVVAKHSTDPVPAQSDVCSDTSNLGIERNHVALQSGIGQVQSLDKNIQKKCQSHFFRILYSLNLIIN